MSEANNTTARKARVVHTHSRLIIQRMTGLPEWEAVAYPADDEVAALKLLGEMQTQEGMERYPRSLRLVRVTTEVLGLWAPEDENG